MQNFGLFLFGFDAWDAELVLYLLSVEHVEYAEGDDLVIWRNVVDDTVMRPFHIEGVWVHECHASNQQQPPPDIPQRIV